MYNVQSKEKRKITTKKIRMASQKNIRRKRNSKYYMNIMMHLQEGIKEYHE